LNKKVEESKEIMNDYNYYKKISSRN